MIYLKKLSNYIKYSKNNNNKPVIYCLKDVHLLIMYINTVVTPTVTGILLIMITPAQSGI